MLSWLATAWRALVALLAYRAGSAAGKADQVQSDRIATLARQVEVNHAVQTAEAAAPTNRKEAIGILRKGEF